MGRPTLQEIADMPFPASERALHKHYGVEPWQDGPLKTWRVRVDWSYSVLECDSFEVSASDEEEALKIAREECENLNGFRDDFEIDCAVLEARPC